MQFPVSPRASILGVVALALLGAVPAFAASPNPFAGSYTWGHFASIAITNGGRVSGSYYHVYPSGPLGGYVREWGELRGRASATGAMSLRMTVRWQSWDGTSGRTEYDLSGSAALDADGNLVLVTNDGSTLVWYRW